jgi:hypothetical protein
MVVRGVGVIHGCVVEVGGFDSFFGGLVIEGNVSRQIGF